MRVNVLVVLLFGFVFSSLEADGQDLEFSFKGLRLGMPVAELEDSLQSTTFFLDGPSYARDYFDGTFGDLRFFSLDKQYGHGADERHLDSLTEVASFYGHFEVGCVSENGYTSCQEFTSLDIHFLGGRVQSIQFQGGRAVQELDTLVELLYKGIERKLGEPVTDNRERWATYGLKAAVRSGGSKVYAAWETSSGSDTLRVSIKFSFSQVDLNASLTSKALKDWYDLHLREEVAAHKEALRIQNEKKVEPDF